MTDRRRMKSDTRSSLPDKGTEPVVIGQGADPFGKEAGAVLAVLILAHLWPGKFNDGWVSDQSLGDHSQDLPKPGKNEPTKRDSLKRNVRTGIAELKKRLPNVAIERRTVRGVAAVRDPREVSTRLRQLTTPELQEWFFRFGINRLNRSSQEDFQEHSLGSLGTLLSQTTALDEALIRRLVERGKLDEAAQHAERALMSARDDHQRSTFNLTLASIDLARESPVATLRVMARLQPLIKSHHSGRSAVDHVLRGRMLMSYATALAYHAFDTLTHETEEARDHLKLAWQLIPATNHGDRGDLYFVEAILEDQEKMYFATRGESEKGFRHRARAELALLAAFNAWRLAQRWDRIGDGLSFLFQMPGGLALPNVEVDRSRLLIPWLNAVRRFWELTIPTSDQRLQTVYWNILRAFKELPDTVSGDALPLTLQESFELVNVCVRALQEYEQSSGRRTVPVELRSVMDAEWYRTASAQQK